MTFNLQVYYLVQRAIKEQKPHYKYSLVPKKLLLFLKESMGIQPRNRNLQFLVLGRSSPPQRDGSC